MKSKLAGCLLLGLPLVLTLSMSGSPEQDRDHRDRMDSKYDGHNVKTPVGLIGVIPIPGNPLVTTDIAWVDPGTKRLYLSDRSNFGIDIIDAENDLFVGRVTGMTGPTGTNGRGPNGVVVTPNKKLWAGDGDSTVQVADVDPISPNYLKIIQSINTAIAECDLPTSHHCDRADEIGYDPEDHIILVANNQPNAPNPPFSRVDPYATFIDADTYSVKGHILFVGATGLEQPAWDPEMRHFFITVPGYSNGGGSNGGFAEVAVIDPKTMKVTNTYKPGNCHASGETLGALQHLLVSCGWPVILNALNGQIIQNITQVGGGDEVWYNPGDGRFYVSAGDNSTPRVVTLGVIDAESGAWLQNVPNPGGRQASALPENNHIFTTVQVTAAMVSDPSTDKTTCSLFGFKGTGCIAVFTHLAETHDRQK